MGVLYLPPELFSPFQISHQTSRRLLVSSDVRLGWLPRPGGPPSP
jgi:hypothetical protein